MEKNREELIQGLEKLGITAGVPLLLPIVRN